MAGVGFELKKLFSARTVVGHLKAYSYTAAITAGPFALLACMVFSVQALYILNGTVDESADLFTAAIVYAFIFSQVFTAGFTMVLTRFVTDCIFVHDYRHVTASLWGMSALVVVLGSVCALLFLWGKPLPFLTSLLAYLCFIQLLLVWTGSVYLSVVKTYKKLLGGYLAGTLLTAGLAAIFLHFGWLLPEQSGLLAMNGGIFLTVCVFFLQITQYFGLAHDGQMFAFLPYFERHWRLFLFSSCYMLGLFLPNIIIWQGKWGVLVGGTFLYAPVYDIVTFYAFLSVLPTMMLFVVSVETRFYEAYAEYFHYILEKGNFRQIDAARRKLLKVLWFELTHIVEFQFVFTLVFLAMGNYLLSFTGLNYNQVTMYNVLLFGAFFTSLMQVFCVLLLYFDDQAGVMPVSVLYAVANLLLGIWGLYWGGPETYGFTFFLASLFAFVLSIHQLSDFSQHINYFVYGRQPLFYQPPHGPFTHLVRWLYGARYRELELEGRKRS